MLPLAANVFLIRVNPLRCRAVSRHLNERARQCRRYAIDYAINSEPKPPRTFAVARL